MKLELEDSTAEQAGAADLLNPPPPPVFFNALQYIASYGDLIQAFGANGPAGEQHYVTAGRSEGRQPDTFDEVQYLANYPDLQAAFGADTEAATVHYIQFGFFEGRTDDALAAASDFIIG